MSNNNFLFYKKIRNSTEILNEKIVMKHQYNFHFSKKKLLIFTHWQRKDNVFFSLWYSIFSKIYVIIIVDHLRPSMAGLF